MKPSLRVMSLVDAYLVSRSLVLTFGMESRPTRAPARDQGL